jgi:hypothetical protein
MNLSTLAIAASLSHVTTEDLRVTVANAKHMSALVMRCGIAYTARTGEDWHEILAGFGVYIDDLARLDSRRTAEPLTRLTADVPVGACVGPLMTPATHLQHGTWRTSLAGH